MPTKPRTDFLVPASSFLIGVATIANLSGGFFRYNKSGSPEEADARALRSDFAMVGQDIRDAAGQLDREIFEFQPELPLS